MRLRFVLVTGGLVTVLGCSGGSGPDSATRATPGSSSPVSRAGPPPVAVAADPITAVRALLDVQWWSETDPGAAMARLDDWTVPGGPWNLQFREKLTDQQHRDLTATGHSEFEDARVEVQSPRYARVLVWLRSDAWKFVGPTETVPSPAFEHVLFVWELTRPDPTQPWRAWSREIPRPQ